MKYDVTLNPEHIAQAMGETATDIRLNTLQFSKTDHFFVSVSFRVHVENSISRKQRREGINPLEVFHTSLGSTYRQKMGRKGLENLGKVPRE
jgi:hypothetical protein